MLIEWRLAVGDPFVPMLESQLDSVKNRLAKLSLETLEDAAPLVRKRNFLQEELQPHYDTLEHCYELATKYGFGSCFINPDKDIEWVET